MKYFQINPQKVAELLATDIDRGLLPQQVLQKQEICGKNQLIEKKEAPLVSRFFAQFKNYMIIILFVAAAISAIMAIVRRDYMELVNTLVIVLIALLNGVFGLLQEGGTKKATRSLEKLIALKAKVIRNNKVLLIESVDLVPGDIILLEAGDMIPADARIIECSALKTNETALTGESLAAEKNIEIISGDNHAPGDLHNMVFSGTLVVSGTAKAIVTAIGMETQIGKIAGMLNSDNDEKTPLQRQMAQMGRVLGLMALAICAVIFVIGIIEGKDFVDMLLTVVSLAVASIPEGLAATVTILLTLGVRQLAKENVVIRRLSAVETLGSTSVICTNKTGTLTQNRLTVSSCYSNSTIYSFAPQNYRNVAEVIFYGSMCNDCRFVEENGELICAGDPTEGAIILALESMGKDRHLFESQYPKMGEIPFDIERKCKSTIHVVNGRNLVVVKGAPEVIYPKCDNAQVEMEVAREAESTMAASGQRVLAIAVKEIFEIPPELLADEIEKDLTFVGLIGMVDPPKETTLQALHSCASADIRTVMVTGDHVVTAKAIAGQMGIYKEGDIALTGSQIEQMEDADFERSIERCSVFARVSSEHKARIVSAWQKKGKIVLMTGNSVSDAPALEQADVGCAIGTEGADVAKNAADMILLEEDFSTVVSAVRLGRGIYNNIKKTVKFLLSGNIAEVLIILISMLFLFNLPLLPLHLLWVNVVITALPGLALGMETARRALMSHPPRNKKESLISKTMVTGIVLNGVLLAVVSLLGYIIGTGFVPHTEDVRLISCGQTMAFAVLALSQVFHAFDLKSRHSILRVGIFNNKPLCITALISVLCLLFVMLVPGVMNVFGTVYLTAGQWITVLLLSLIPFSVCEIIKWIQKA